MKLSESLESGWHKFFTEINGNYSGSSKVWFEPGEPIDSAEVQGDFHSILNNQFVQFSYATSFQGKPIQGIMTFGVFLSTNQFQMSWVDTFHTGTAIMHSVGEAVGDVFNVKTTYPAGEKNEQMWGWRTELERKSPNQLVIRAFNSTPDGEETLATEFVLERK